MLEIRFHGRGGTGSVLASRALAKAAFYAGKHAIAFPSFGAERRGALVLAFARISDKKIYTRTQIYEPDVIVVLDDSLIEIIDVAQGLKADGIGIINSQKKPEKIQLSKSIKAMVVDANKIAEDFLGVPITNSAMLGAFIKGTEIIDFKHLEEGIMSVFGSRLGDHIAKKNVEAARIAYEETIIGQTQGGKNNTKMQTWLPTVEELPIGTIIPKITTSSGENIGPGAAITRVTGTWSHEKAYVDPDKCIQCLQCLFHCPEGTIHRDEDKVKVIKKYCKGCGVCVAVCPVKAITLKKIEDYSEII